MRTTVIKVDPADPAAKDIACGAKVLREGGLVAFPTETVYGLLCRWDDSVGRERIFRMKCRAPEKPLQMLADSLDRALTAGVLADEEGKRAQMVEVAVRQDYAIDSPLNLVELRQRLAAGKLGV